jgi:DNA modification methylase
MPPEPECLNRIDVRSDDIRIIHGDCRDVLPMIVAGSVDAVICDPIYPEIERPYGRITEADWFDLMRLVVAESRRILKPSGSAVFILQPNSRVAGSVRGWLWRFMGWACDEWNMVQDAWWWNYTTPPIGGAPHRGLLRPSVKACVWLGPPDCYRDQSAVLWEESERNKAMRSVERADRHSKGDRRVDRVNNRRMGEAALNRGGVTPFNLIPVPGGDRWSGGGVDGHTASTPPDVAAWWVRYITPAGGVVCDPFCGSGVIGSAAVSQWRTYIGIDRDVSSVEIARRRVSASLEDKPLWPSTTNRGSIDAGNASPSGSSGEPTGGGPGGCSSSADMSSSTRPGCIEKSGSDSDILLFS